MTRVKEEAVASFPSWVFRIIYQKFREQYIDKVGATHCATRVSGISFLNHRSSKDTDVVRCKVHKFLVVHIIKYSYDLNILLVS